MTITPLDPADTDRRFAEIVDEVTRRGFLGASIGAATLVGASGCGADGDTTSGSSGTWSFTDDLGHTITLPHRPTRIASMWDSITASLWAAGVRDIVATQLAPTQAHVLSGSHVATSGMAKVKNGDTPEVRIEELAKANPDLILDSADADGTLSSASTNSRIAQIAPIVAFNESTGDVETQIRRSERFAAALGIAGADDAGRAQYRSAFERLQRVTAAKPTLRVAFCWGYDDGLYIYPPNDFSVWIPTLRSAGVNFMPAKPTAGPDSGGFHVVAWERALDLPVDLLLEKGGPWPIDNPGWRNLPAVRAGQAYDTDDWGAAGWDAYSYANYATLLDRTAEVIGRSRPGVGPR